jgi:hypothetical protein
MLIPIISFVAPILIFSTPILILLTTFLIDKLFKILIIFNYGKIISFDSN